MQELDIKVHQSQHIVQVLPLKSVCIPKHSSNFSKYHLKLPDREIIISSPKKFKPKEAINKEISYNGFRYYYRLEGQLNTGTPLLFLSGAFQNMNAWKKAVSYFIKEMPVLLTDLPGMGDADCITHNHSYDLQAKALLNLMDVLNIKKINIFSASYSTPIAIRFAQLYPNRTNRLILSGALINIPKIARKKIIDSVHFLKKRDLEAFASNMCNTIINQNSECIINKKIVNRILYTTCLRLSTKEQSHYINASKRLLTQIFPVDTLIKVKTLIFTGKFDSFTSPEYCFSLTPLFKKVYFTTLEGTDHLNHLEKYDEVVEIVKFFLCDI